MTDRQRRIDVLVAGERGERHPFAGRGHHVHLAQRLRPLRIARVDFHHHPVLVPRLEDGGDDRLGERIAERRVDQVRGDAEPRCGRPVDDDVDLQSLRLLVAVDVGQRRLRGQRILQPLGPEPQQVDVVAAQRVLVAAAALPAAGADVLDRRQEEPRPGHAELEPEPVDHLPRGLAALGQRLQLDIHLAGRPVPAAGRRGHARDRGIGPDPVDEELHLLAGQLERTALVAAHPADQLAGVLLRHEALRDLGEHPDVETDRRDQREQRQERVPERKAQAAVIAAHHRRAAPLDQAAPPRHAARRDRLEQQRAHHRRQRQRHDHRNQHRDRQRQRELAEQPADQVAHQQDRQEHRDQRQAHRNDGRTDLARTLERRCGRGHAGFDMAGRVLQHHDRIVDDEAGRDDQRHQREVVDAEPGQVHERERADQRDRHGRRRNQRRAGAAQEGIDHQHDQHHCDQQRLLDLPDRRPDHRGPLERELQTHRGRDDVAQHRQQRLDPVGRRDDVGVRLAIDQQQHRRDAVGRARVLQVLDRIGHPGDVGQPDRGAVAHRDDQRQVFTGAARLVVGVDPPLPIAVLDQPFRPIRVRRGERGPNLVEAQSALAQRGRIDLDPHGRQRAAADRDLADALHLGELLREDRRRDVEHLALARRRRGQRDDHDRRVGRVHLPVGRIVRQRRRQLAAGRIDRRLDLDRRVVDVPVQVELQDHPGAPERRRRRDLVDPGDAAERPLERRRHGRRHRLGARTGQARRHRDDRELDLRQRRDRQLGVGGQPGEHRADGQQEGADRTGDERGRQVHRTPCGRGASAWRRPSEP